MRFSRNFLSFFALTLLMALSAQSEDKIKILCTLPTYASIAKDIGGEWVEVSSVASPRFNPHFIEPKPSDVLRLKRTDLFIHSGLDLEAWRSPLVDASANAAVRPGGDKELDLSKEIALKNVPQGAVSRAQGDIHLFGNPHYWIDPENGLRIAKEIKDKFEALFPEHKLEFSANYEKFKNKLDAEIPKWKKDFASYAGAKFIGYHDEWIYLMKFLGLEMNEFLEPKPGIPPTPKHIEELKNYIQTNHVKGIIQPSYYPQNAANSLSESNGVKVLLICQNVNELEQCSDYFSMMQYDISTILAALKS